MNDFIFVDSWQNIAVDLANLGRNVVYATTEFVRETFEKIRQDGRPTFLLSGCCDYSIRLQEENHPNADFPKHVNATPWGDIAKEREVYPDILLKSPCVRENCKPKDTYAVRMDRHTICTFSDEDVPPNLSRWLTTNLDVENPRMGLLPFGLNTDGDGWKHLAEMARRPREKKGLLYVNFQNYTDERVNLKRFFKHVPWVTFRDDASLLVEQFLAEVAEHKFVLSPFGNGLDCYRNYECMYLGSIPILPLSTISKTMGGWGLPIIAVPQDQYFGLTEQLLEEVWQQMAGCPFKYERLSLRWWVNHLEQESRGL